MINRVTLIGRLTRDAELKKTQQGTSVCTFTIAVNRTKQKDKQQEADFINCVAWRQTADFLGQYARKGALVGVEGRIQTRNYDNASGQKVYVTEVVCENVQFLDNKQVTPQTDPRETGYAAARQSQNDLNEFDTGPTLDISSDDLPFN